MSDFEYDNEFDAIDDQLEGQQQKKKPISKEVQNRNIYARKKDTDDSYDNFEPIDQFDAEEKGASDKKKGQPLAPINNKPDPKKNKLEEIKPKAEESKPKAEDKKPKAEEKPQPKQVISIVFHIVLSHSNRAQKEWKIEGRSQI